MKYENIDIIEVNENNIDIIKQIRRLILKTSLTYNRDNYKFKGILMLLYSLTIENIIYRINNNHKMIVAMKGKEVVGIIEIELSYFYKCGITSFYVKEKYQHKGIGKKLFSYAINKCIEENKDAKYIYINSTDYALPIYKKLGCIEETKIYFSFANYTTLKYRLRQI